MSRRTYGDFALSASASSLFDQAFSKPIVRKRFNKITSVISSTEEPELPSVVKEQHSPEQVSSLTSLPENRLIDENNEGCVLEQSDSEHDEPMDLAPIKRVKSSFTRSLPILTSKETCSTLVSHKRPAAITYNFDQDEEEIENHEPKKVKKDDSESDVLHKAKFTSFKERKNAPVYRHTWKENMDDMEEKSLSNETNKIPIYKHNATNKSEASYRIHKVKDARQCLESGELDDFKQDVEYIMTSLNNQNVSIKIKSLSALTLTKKCGIRSFRKFIRNELGLSSVIKLFPDSAKDDCMALAVSAFIYLLARDFVAMKVDIASLKIIAQLLKVEMIAKTAETKNFIDQIWQVFQDFKEQYKNAGHKINIEITKENLTPSQLMLESIVFIVARTHDAKLKTELLNLGCLQFVVVKIEKAVLKLIYDKTHVDIEEQLVILDRGFRIIEICTTYHKKNQHFLVSHRGSILIQICEKLISYFHEKITETNTDSSIISNYFKTVSLVARVLINLSHGSELCSSKLGMINGFLQKSLQTYTFLTPKYAPMDRKFDATVMVQFTTYEIFHCIQSLGLIVNLVEKVNSNRVKILNSTVKVYNDDGSEKEENALDVLVRRFVMHLDNGCAHDEDLDKELAFMEPADDNDNSEEEGLSHNGRLDREKMDDMSEAEMIEVVQKAMGKASAHMEDSVTASYLSLVIGCLLQQNYEYVTAVKALLPNANITLMKDQLQRFQDFMKIAHPNSKGSVSIGKIIAVFEDLERN